MPLPQVAQQNKCITLKGSAAMVRQYLEYGMSNVLYQRGACPPEHFEQTKYYGLNLFKATHRKHAEYFAHVLGQIENFLAEKEVASVTLVLINKDTREYLENWKFMIDYEEKCSTAAANSYGSKDPQSIQNEISAVVRQILGTTTVLPLLKEDKITYEIHASQRPGVPQWNGWRTVTENTTIANQQTMQFRSFSTSIHSIQSTVYYKGA
ncbi:mitotic spindle assembly checkpoint protein MAD2A-like [Copidosoma floridanum]|uniref:mitotic spindle assembly checkpoint protein MAD2A-like n=1 Tax=Copidosoma floridanum TaxID=29053 RepID=UPI0006C96E1B|nr:mitotic spindle assembly checkpoint protein MAD2A-like [Copidosoma floridanum]